MQEVGGCKLPLALQLLFHLEHIFTHRDDFGSDLAFGLRLYLLLLAVLVVAFAFVVVALVNERA